MSEKWIVGNMQERLVKRTPTSTEILVPDADGEWWLAAEFNGNGHYAKAERAVACVNACAGMVDPAKEIAELGRKAGAWDTLMAAAIAIIPHAETPTAVTEALLDKVKEVKLLRDQNAAMRGALERIEVEQNRDLMRGLARAELAKGTTDGA